jgi:hypothetical protein
MGQESQPVCDHAGVTQQSNFRLGGPLTASARPAREEECIWLR